MSRASYEKIRTYATICGISLAAAVFFGTIIYFIPYWLYKPSPKELKPIFTVGQCIINKDKEPWETEYYIAKVLQLGKKSYLIKHILTSEKSYVLDYEFNQMYEVVPCPCGF